MTHKVTKLISKFSATEIDTLFNTAKAAYKNKELVILTAPSSFSFGRVLIITSKKVGNAPERNLIRRQLKSIFYQNKLFEKQRDCIIITRSEIKQLSFQQLESIIKKVIT
jgi:ribonuclease P protein component